jgi:hypothetical protein
MVTHDTTEFSLTFAVALFGVSTYVASLRGVGRIAIHHRHSLSLRFVVNKRPQLTKSPIAVSCALLRPFNPRPRSDAFEILKGNRALRAFGFRNELLADTVIGILLKAPLTPAQAFQATFGRLGADLLKRLPPTGVPLAAAFNPLTAEALAITIRRQIVG